MDWIRDRALDLGWQLDTIHRESFSAPVFDITDSRPFDVVLARRGITLHVPAGSTTELYAAWLVRHAVHVQVQGQPVASAGERPVPLGARLELLQVAGKRAQHLQPTCPGWGFIAVPLVAPRPVSHHLDRQRSVVAKTIDPPGDNHATAAYRAHVAGVLTRRCLAEAAERAGAGGAR